MAIDDELPWTTTRCNRLLRPISSKLAKLRKELERPRPAGTGRQVSSAFATKYTPQKTTNFTRPAHKPRGFDKARDPDWRPQKKTGSKKTYGGRGAAKRNVQLQSSSSDAAAISRPGEIAFTPLIARMDRLHSSPQIPISPLRKYTKKKGPFSTIDTTLEVGDVQKLTKGLLEAYANLLQATSTTGEGKNRRGTRSLASACLRKLPAYIELEEYFAALDKELEEEDEDRDIAADIYEHLESQFEQRAGQGWRPFKQVARAHGTSLLCQAIADEILDLESLSLLLTHCLCNYAWDEAETLLLAYVPLLEPLPMPLSVNANLFDQSRFIFPALIKTFVNHTRRFRLLYDFLEHMIAHELLPLEWLATKCMREVWDRLALIVSSKSHPEIANVFQFFESVTLAGMGLPDERLLADVDTGGIRRFVPSSREDLRVALNTTYSSLVTVLCSIALVNNARDDDVGPRAAQRITWMLNAVLLKIADRRDVGTELRFLEADILDVKNFAQRASWAVFASFLIHSDGCKTDDTMISIQGSDVIKCLNNTLSQYSAYNINTALILGTLPTLVSSVAQGTGRIWGDDGSDQLERLTNPMMSLSSCRLPHKLWTLKRLALESAMEFAQNTGDPEHLAYVREIEKKMQTAGRLVIMSSPHKTDSPPKAGGFKWEEGIGEWVACTPAFFHGVKRKGYKLVPAPELAAEPKVYLDDETLWNGVGSSDEDAEEVGDEDDPMPWSSPIKQQSTNSPAITLGKRTRASSPIVLVPIKRSRQSPTGSPVTFHSSLPEADIPQDKIPQDEPRQLRRSRAEIKDIAARLRGQRSRISLASGLRNQQRKTYVEQAIIIDDMSDTSDSEPSSSISSTTSSATSSPKPSSRKRTRLANPTSSKIASPTSDAEEEAEEELSEHDELGKTPSRAARPQRSTKTRGNVKPKPKPQSQWWKVRHQPSLRRSLIHNSEDASGSEDELSFH